MHRLLTVALNISDEAIFVELHTLMYMMGNHTLVSNAKFGLRNRIQ